MYRFFHNSSCYLQAFMLLTMLFGAKGLAQSPSFSYSSPVCANSGTLLPTLSPGWPGGGFYSSSPGININGFNGRINPNFSTPGTYVINYTGSSCNCVVTTTIKINPVPQISIANLTLCNTSTEASVTISASPSTGLTYTWQNTGTHDPTLSVASNQVNQSYTLDVTDANGCSNRAVKSGTVFTAQPIIVSGPNSACEGATITLSASGASGYTWSTGQQGSSITVTLGTITNYSVTGKDSKGCITAGNKNLVVVSISSVTANSHTICATQSVTLRALSDESGLTYMWQPGNVNGDSVVVAPPATSDYTLIASINGCSVTKTLTVTVIPSKTVSLAFYYNGPLCTNSSSVLPIQPDTSAKGGIYKSDLPIDPATGMLVMTPSSAGSHLVTYSLATKECSLGGTYTVGLEVGVGPDPDLPEIIQIKEGTSVSLSLYNVTWVAWFPPEFLSCNYCPDPVANPPQSVQYCATGVLNGCFSRQCVIIEVVCDNPGDFSVPNAFTPNGDLNNDKFCLQGWIKCVTDFSVRIYDRWGEEVFSSQSPNFCWDGTFHGSFLNSGVFVYVIKARYNKEPEMVKKGNITLIR